jgi:hypothetical protein
MNETKWIAHHGILGQKWGVRRYQNPDGSLTEAGKRRLSQGKQIKNFDQKKYDMSENRAGRVSDTQKKKYNYNKALDLEESLDRRSKELMSDPTKWSKEAREYAKERALDNYYFNPEVNDAYKYSEREFVDKFMKDFASEYQSIGKIVEDTDPAFQKILKQGNDYIANIIDKEGHTGITEQKIRWQIQDDVIKRKTNE